MRARTEETEEREAGRGNRVPHADTVSRQAGKEEGAREADMRRKKGSPIAMEFWDAARTGRERERERERESMATKPAVISVHDFLLQFDQALSHPSQ